MAEIRWTDEAQRWLQDIYEYIAADNPDAAARTVQGIYDRAQDLATFPEIGQRKPRFTAKEILWGKRDERFSEFASRGWLILVGVLFWAALLTAVLAAVGPLKPIHEWRS